MGRGGAAGADEAEAEAEAEDGAEAEAEAGEEDEAGAAEDDEDEEEDEDEAVVAGSRIAPSSTSLFRRIALIGSELWWMSDDKERVVCAGAKQMTVSRAIAWTKDSE